MMGLLDPTDDPRTMGLLSLGLGLLGSKGSFGNALSQAGPQALQAMRQVKQDKQRSAQEQRLQQMQEMQMQQAQMQLAESQRAQQAQQRRGSYLDSINPAAGPAMQFNPAAALGAGLKPEEIEMFTAKAQKPLIVGDTVLDPATMKPVWSAPQKPEKDPEAIRVLKMIHGENTPAFVSAMADYGRKMTTHAPAASAVSYGSPVPIMLPDGSIGYAQPGNRAGAAPVVMTAPDGSPLKKPAGAESAPTEDERKAAGWVSQAENAWANMRAAAFDQRGNIKADAKPSALETLAPHEVAKNAVRSPGRQKFVQASSSLSESLLRAATGAGVNRDEAEQKVRELTPQPLDSQEVIKQKMDAIPPYLESLRTRANRALPKGLAPVAPVPGAGNGGAKFLGFEGK